MRPSDWVWVAANALAAFLAFMGAADPDPESSVVLLLLMSCVLTVNSVVIARRARQRGDAEVSSARTGTQTETDVHAVLDFDARLEALERAQRDALDAARWRPLVEGGQVTAPTVDTAPVAGDARRQSVAG